MFRTSSKCFIKVTRDQVKLDLAKDLQRKIVITSGSGNISGSGNASGNGNRNIIGSGNTSGSRDTSGSGDSSGSVVVSDEYSKNKNPQVTSIASLSGC